MSHAKTLESQRLATRYDALTAAWAEAVKKLRSLKPIHIVHAGALSIRKIEKPAETWTWRVCVGDTPIEECPLDLRVSAVNDLWLLHEAIVKSKADFLPVLEEAIEVVERFVQEFPIKEKP